MATAVYSRRVVDDSDEDSGFITRYPGSVPLRTGYSPELARAALVFGSNSAASCYPIMRTMLLPAGWRAVQCHTEINSSPATKVSSSGI